MALYGVQFHWDCEEHGLSVDQRTFEAVDDGVARSDFKDWVDAIRLDALKPNSPQIAGDIRLFRLNPSASEGTLLMAVAA